MAISRAPLSGANTIFVNGDAITEMNFSWGNTTDPIAVGDIVFLTGMQKGGASTTGISATISGSSTAMTQFDLQGTDWPALVSSKRYYFAYYHKVVSGDLSSGRVAVNVSGLNNGTKYHASIEIWRGIDLSAFDGNPSGQAINALPTTHAEDTNQNMVVTFVDYDSLVAPQLQWANTSVYPGNCTALAFGCADRASNWDARTWTGGIDVLGNTIPEHNGSGVSTIVGYRNFTSLSNAVASTSNGLGTPWSHTGVNGSGSAHTVRDSNFWILLPMDRS